MNECYPKVNYCSFPFNDRIEGKGIINVLAAPNGYKWDGLKLLNATNTFRIDWLKSILFSKTETRIVWTDFTNNHEAKTADWQKSMQFYLVEI